MALGAPPTAYDRAAIIFSPEGDLYQVRYAFEAVKKGWTSIGVRGRDAVVLAAEKRKISPLLDIVGIEKIYKVDDHVGVVFAGMGSDGRVLIDYARLVAVRHRLLYGEPPTVDYLAKQIADLKQVYTQHGGVRPFGVALIFGGINPDGRPRLIRTDPGGQYFSYYAVAIGMGDTFVNEFFEKEYKPDAGLDELIKLVLTAIFKSRVRGGEEKAEDLVKELHMLVEIGYITTDERTFKMLTADELKRYVDEIKGELLG
ncbi:MAG: archaeal proteasome endopeptidase complex subunit alpha [Desulfurococcales archaeon]|nr:archaeal proteasome endopeptidase complex subunit alpha [Desulfurococcales archaeon]